MQSGRIGKDKAEPRRLDHVDAAKGLSIFLVVYWHAVDARLILNEVLWMLRMPLFFFVAGLFARSALEREWRPFLREKIGNFLYLYIVWSFLVFFTTIAVAQASQGAAIEWWRPFTLFTEPPRTLWFIYALAVTFVLAKLLGRLPWLPVFAVSLLLYFWSISSGDWRTPPFPEKVIRLFPFFFLALNAKDRVLGLVERHYRSGWLALPVFACLALAIFASGANHVGILTFPAGLLGVAGVLMTARRLDENAIVRVAVLIGKRSLYIYVLHRIPLFYFANAAELAGIESSPWLMSAIALLVTAICLAAGKVAVRLGMRNFFAAPWAAGAILPERRTLLGGGASRRQHPGHRL